MRAPVSRLFGESSMKRIEKLQHKVAESRHMPLRMRVLETVCSRMMRFQKKVGSAKCVHVQIAHRAKIVLATVGNVSVGLSRNGSSTCS